MMALENCAEEFDLVWRRELLHPERKSHGDLMKDFECCCCQEVMIDPTTLNCGHSLCRHCLASWFLKSKKRECPQCKQTWTGHPKVNLILRNTIELLCKETVSRRRSDLEEEGEYRNTVKEFDQRLGDGGSQGGEEHNRGFCSGLLFSLFGLLVLYVLWYWGHGDYNLLVHKPLQHWRVSDVETWLSELGEWAKPYAQHARETNIDGTLLMNIDEENIVSVLNVTSPLHLKAVLSSLNLAKDLGVKPPQNLWDFKELYRGQSLFLLYGMKDFPRLTMLYSYIFAYDEVVVPFVQFTVRDQSVALEDYHRSKLPPPTSSQWREFLVKMLLFPYFLIVVFASHWLEAHYWTSRFIMCNSVALTVLEVIAVWRFVRGNWRSPHSRVMAYLRSWLSMGIFAAAWPLIPVIFTDCMFYVALFYSPFLSIERLYKEFR